MIILQGKQGCDAECKNQNDEKDIDTEAIESHPMNDDYGIKPRRGSRKKRVVDYYDGPDRDAKKDKDSGKKSKASKVKGIVYSEHSTLPKHNERESMQPGTRDDAKILASRNDGAVMFENSINYLPKKAKIGGGNVRKGKTMRKGEVENQNSIDYCIEATSDSNPTMGKNVENATELKLKVVRISEPLEKMPGHVVQSGKKKSKHTTLVTQNDLSAENSVIISDNKISSSHMERDPAGETRRDLQMSEEQISAKRCFPEQCQTVNDGEPILKASQKKKYSSDTIKSVIEKDDMKEEDLSVFAANMASSIKTLLPLNAIEFLSTKASDSRGAEENNFEKNDNQTQEQHEIEKFETESLEEEAIEAKKRDEIRRRKEETVARQKAKEEEEKRKREEKAKRLEEHKKRRKLEAEAAVQVGSAATGVVGPSSGSGGSLAAAKERLAKIQQQAAMLKGQKSNVAEVLSSGKAISRAPQISMKNITGNILTPQPLMTISSPDGRGDKMPDSKSHHKSYEISPYRSDHDSDDEVPKKPVPDWARGKALMAQLFAQMYVDPDEVFQQHAKTCSLDQVFESCRKPGKTNFDRRSSSGNWIEDRVTWKEEVGYKKAMGYI